jgi:hypothetical protein
MAKAASKVFNETAESFQNFNIQIFRQKGIFQHKTMYEKFGFLM